MTPFDEPRVRQALVRIRTKGGSGTGFFFDDDLVMTCHHVVDGQDAIRIEDASGQTASATLVEELSVPDVDVAVLRVSSRAPVMLPLGSAPTQPEEVWISGFQLQSANLRGPLPTGPKLAGTTEIEYLHRQKYALRNVLRLAGGTISGGISGAPVVVMPEGVAVAVTTADFKEGGGFAVPVQQALEQSEALREHVRKLDERIPAHGRYLNAAAARALCAAQVERALTVMSDRRQFLPDKYVERQKLTETLRAFRRSDEQILPVIGISGIGKTNTLAAIAQSAPPAVFLPAHRAKFDDRGLAATLSAELGADAEGLVDALRASRLLVILDGLNEAQALTQPAGRAWLEDTFEWLKGRPVQLVVTSRVEFWSLIADLFPQRLLFAEKDEQGKKTGTSWFDLQPFDGNELHHAAETYGLSADAAEDTALRHPLLIRLYWELGARGARVGMYALFERFVEDRTLKVSLALGVPGSRGTVQHALRVAARLADPKTLAIPAAQLIDELAPVNNVREALVAENLLVESAGAYRFLFDELADYLMAQEREVPNKAKGWQELFEKGAQRTGWMRFALLHLERTAPDDFIDRLQTITAAYKQRVGRGLEDLVEQTITAAEHPESLGPVVLQLARAVVARTGNERDVNFSEIATRTGLTSPERLEIARPFLSDQHYYDWEEKHWRDISAKEFYAHLRPWYRSHTAPAMVMAALEHDYRAAVPVLLGWLGDQTALREGGAIANVGDIARAFLFHTRHFDLPYLVSQVAERAATEQTGGRELLSLVARYDAEAILPFVEEWVERNDPRYPDLAMHALTAVNWSRSDEWVARAERAVERVLERRSSPNGIANALSIASSRPRLAAAAFEEIFSRFLHDDSGVSGYTLRRYAPTNFDRLLSGIETYLENRSSKRRGEAIYALAEPAMPPEQLVRLAESLSHMFVKYPELAYPIARDVEDVLYEVEAPSQACEDFLALAKTIVIQGEEGPRVAALYGITATGKGPAMNAAQEALIDDLCTGDYPPDVLENLLHQLAHSRFASDAEMQRIHRLATRIDGAPDGTASLKHVAFGSDAFAKRFAEWAAEQPVTPGSPVERFLTIMREKNLKPEYAADAVLES